MDRLLTLNDMSKSLIALTLAAASFSAMANNNEDAGKCVAYGAATNKESLMKDALKMANNRSAAMVIAKKEIKFAGTIKDDKNQMQGLAYDWINGCRSIGLQASSY
jgi:hypothetical protein